MTDLATFSPIARAIATTASRISETTRTKTKAESVVVDMREAVVHVCGEHTTSPTRHDENL
jgi:hypothetical protein